MNDASSVEFPKSLMASLVLAIVVSDSSRCTDGRQTGNGGPGHTDSAVAG